MMELSALLNKFRTDQGPSSLSTLRNPNGVYLKLCNFRAKDQPGHGMAHGNHLENDVWGRFVDNPVELHQAAATIRSRRRSSSDAIERRVPNPAESKRTASIDSINSFPILDSADSPEITRPLMALIREATELQLAMTNDQPVAVKSDRSASLERHLEDRIDKMFGLLADVAAALRISGMAAVPRATAAKLSRTGAPPFRAGGGPKLVIFPCGGGSSVRHFNRTVRRPVDLTAIGLNWNQTSKGLPADYPYAQARVWGVMPRRSGMNEKRFLRCSPGDVAVFTGGKKAFCAATIQAKLRSQEIARALWHTDASGQTWELIFLLSDPIELRISYESLSEALGYHPNFAYQSFSVLSEEATARARRAFEAEIGRLWV